jgi:hypothetical protein
MRTAADRPAHGALWRGVHLLLRSDGEVDALLTEVPHLSEMGINVLIVEINYNLAYDTHPELRAKDQIGKSCARRLAQTCRDRGIRLVPQFQCLGHQSWEEETFPLLVQNPQFDETPGQYPRNEGIYCRSWCPQHPAVNPIVYDLFDELLEVFEADALHVGMDEVFLIASEHCPRCRGQDSAELFARAVNDYHTHLVERRGVEMLIWGDRLLDARTTGYGEWESAANGTHPAIDLIPRDVVICDWHYTLRDEYPSLSLFLQEGFRIWPAGWREVPAVEALIDCALQYVDARMLGYLCTTWGAVRPEELSQWLPIQVAAEKLR